MFDTAITRAEHDAALRTARAEARVVGETAGRTQAMERIRAILTAPEAKGRWAQALAFALDTDMAPDVAARALVASPAATAPARPPLDARSNPSVPGGGAAAAWDRSFERARAKQQT